MSDLISRQAVINALEKEKPTPFVNEDGSIDPFGAGRQNQWYRDDLAIMNLPSAQPTVKAIPIEWINSYTTGLIFSDDYEDNADSIDYYISCIKEMVRDWEKENDKMS